MSVAVETKGDFRITGRPKALFSAARLNAQLVTGFDRMYDVMPDGNHFVVVQAVGEDKSEVVVVQNWFKEFEKEE